MLLAQLLALFDSDSLDLHMQQHMVMTELAAEQMREPATVIKDSHSSVRRWNRDNYSQMRCYHTQLHLWLTLMTFSFSQRPFVQPQWHSRVTCLLLPILQSPLILV